MRSRQKVTPKPRRSAFYRPFFIHLANAGSQFEDMLIRYVRHVDVYTSFRSAGCDLNPIDVGEEFPAGFREAVRDRLLTYQREYEALLQDREVLDLRRGHHTETTDHSDTDVKNDTPTSRVDFVGGALAKLKRIV
jgi:hypothetical protein